MSWESVSDWLCHIEAGGVHCNSIATTRKASRKRGLASPPMSTTPRKKRKDGRVDDQLPKRHCVIDSNNNNNNGNNNDDDHNDDDHNNNNNNDEADADMLQEQEKEKDTPRAAKRTRSEPDNNISISTSTYTSTSSVSMPPQYRGRMGSSPARSNYSTRSSPTKQMAKMHINGDMQYRMMDNDGSDDFPEPLAKLLDPIRQATTLCQGLLSESQRREIREYALADPTHRRGFEACHVNDVLFAADQSDECEGEEQRHLDPEFVAFILDEARECDENLHPEASWNMLVHYPLLRRAIMGPSRRLEVAGSGRPVVDVVPCTTASLVSNFKIRGAPAHKVDFAVALAPGRSVPERTVADLIEARREFMPGLSINHTDYAPLLHRPIAISVETKRTNDDFEKARVQLMVWLAAQWKKIESVTDRPPDILPAIIIQGHDWYLVASTRAGNGKKLLWCKHEFGSTSTALGIYKIAWTLRYLSRWAINIYWSWFKGAYLDFEGT
ncbi:hypothetical protein F5Y12DRAFT_769074 [Xylaria sp. FL1777]|nr:hypothetical protein F5Y12DRAFT_769074 [Xylaria sp. FL1777]